MCAILMIDILKLRTQFLRIYIVSAVDVQYVKDSNEDRKKAYIKEGAWRKSTQTEVEVINSDLLKSEFGGGVYFK